MPIPENAVKELLSRNFLKLVASAEGFVPGVDELDFGVDVNLRHVDCILQGERPTFRASGFSIDVQLKATCEANVAVANGQLIYDLDVNTHNDLVRRVHLAHTIPLVLALFVLPDDPSAWLSLSDIELVVRRCVYVWRPPVGTAESANASTTRISIPLINRVHAATFGAIRDEYIQ